MTRVMSPTNRCFGSSLDWSDALTLRYGSQALLPPTMACNINEVSTRTWAVSLDSWPNRTWACARILFFNSAQACCVRLVASVRRDFFLTFLDLLTTIYMAIYMSTCEKITRKKSHVYLELSAKRASIRTYINMHAWKNVHTFIFVC